MALFSLSVSLFLWCPIKSLSSSFLCCSQRAVWRTMQHSVSFPLLLLHSQCHVSRGVLINLPIVLHFATLFRTDIDCLFVACLLYFYLVFLFLGNLVTTLKLWTAETNIYNCVFLPHIWSNMGYIGRKMVQLSELALQRWMAFSLGFLYCVSTAALLDRRL